MNKYPTPEVPLVTKMSELLKESRSYLGIEPTESLFAYYETDLSGGGRLYVNSGLTRSYVENVTTVKYRAKYQLAFDSMGRVYSLRRDNVEILDRYPDIVPMFKTALMAMYAGHTTLEVDMTP